MDFVDLFESLILLILSYINNKIQDSGVGRGGKRMLGKIAFGNGEGESRSFLKPSHVCWSLHVEQIGQFVGHLVVH